MSLNQATWVFAWILLCHGHVAVDSLTSDHSVFGEELTSAQRMM